MVDCNAPSSKRECRIEVSTRFAHPLFGTSMLADLVVPWDQGLDGHKAAALLNLNEQTVENETLGVGAWHANCEDGSLRYRILLPFLEKWTPPVEQFVSDLVMRWMSFPAAGPEMILDGDLEDPLRCLFATMREGEAQVAKIFKRSQDGQCSMDDYYRDRAAREVIAAMAGMSVQALGRHHLGPPLRRPRQRTQRKRPKS